VSDVTWAVPTALALAGVLLIVAVIVLIVRASRRSPRARAAAEAARVAAEESLLRLDDAANELDIAFEASGAREAGESATALRRSHAAILRGRDRGFSEVVALSTSPSIPARRCVEAQTVRVRLDALRSLAETTRADLAEWAQTHGSPTERVQAARTRLDDTVRTAGDPTPLIAGLRERFAEEDWSDAAHAATAATASLTAAEEALDAAQAGADPVEVDRLVVTATDATRRAARQLRAVEDAHRIALQAADNAEDELRAARAELTAALELATSRPDACAPDAAQRLRDAISELDIASADASRRPRAAIDTVARLREVRDEAVGEALSARRRLEAARAALPGTLACARAALAATEARDDGESIHERLRRDQARRELAAARAATDAGQALANARTAWRGARAQ